MYSGVPIIIIMVSLLISIPFADVFNTSGSCTEIGARADMLNDSGTGTVYSVLAGNESNVIVPLLILIYSLGDVNWQTILLAVDKPLFLSSTFINTLLSPGLKYCLSKETLFDFTNSPATQA